MADMTARAVLVAGAMQSAVAEGIGSGLQEAEVLSLARKFYAEMREMMQTGESQAQIEQVFPGTTEVAPPPQAPPAPLQAVPTAQPAPAPQQQYAPPQAVPQGTPGPAAVHAGMSSDDAWANVVGELQAGGGKSENWWDNRASKKSPNGPDWAHKSVTKADKNNVMRKYALWMKDCPDWAKPIINGFPAYQPQAPQQQAPPPAQVYHNQDQVPLTAYNPPVEESF